MSSRDENRLGYALIGWLSVSPLKLVKRGIPLVFEQLCVCCFVLLNRYWGIVTVPGSIPYGSRRGVAGSSPFTLTTSVVIRCVCCFVLLTRYWGIVTVPGSVRCVLLCFIINRYWGIVTVPVSIPYGSRPGVAGSSPFTSTTTVTEDSNFASKTSLPPSSYLRLKNGVQADELSAYTRDCNAGSLFCRKSCVLPSFFLLQHTSCQQKKCSQWLQARWSLWPANGDCERGGLCG